MARKPEFRAKRVEGVAVAEQVERQREAQTQLIPVERHRLDLREHLGQIYRRHADFCSDFGERPAPREIGRQREFGAVHEATAS